MFITFIVVISWVHAYVQSHQIVSIKNRQFILYQLCINKIVPQNVMQKLGLHGN